MKIFLLSVFALFAFSACSMKVENNYYGKDGKKIEKESYEK